MNYTQSIHTKATQKNAFLSIASGIDKWWGKIDNPVSKVNDEFSIFFGSTEWRFKIIEYTEYEKITWKCIKANHVHNGLTNIKEEWLGTELYWKFKKENKFTEISFIHKGLNPGLNCYKVCEGAWSFFIPKSLKNYLDTGIGNPFFA